MSRIIAFPRKDRDLENRSALHSGNLARQALNNALEGRHFFDDLLERYLSSKTCKVSPNYLLNHSIVLKAVIRDLGGITSALQSSSRTLELWRDRKLSSVKVSTVGAYLFAFKLFLEWCRKEGIVEINAANPVELPRHRKPFRKVFGSAEMVRILIEECDDPDLEYILYAGFHAGMRKGEIIASRPSWFDLEQGMVNVTRSDDFDTKDGEDRSVPLTRAFAAYLQVYHVHGEFMLENNRSKPGQRYRYDFRAKFGKYMVLKCKEHGFPRLTIHDMRRTFASLIASSRSISMYELARWLGDGLDVVIKHYSHLQPHDGAINNAFGRQQEQAPKNASSNPAVPVASHMIGAPSSWSEQPAVKDGVEKAKAFAAMAATLESEEQLQRDAAPIKVRSTRRLSNTPPDRPEKFLARARR